jgi:hypothetical protein
MPHFDNSSTLYVTLLLLPAKKRKDKEQVANTDLLRTMNPLSKNS